MKQKDATMVMGRRDGATVAAFGDRGMRGGTAGAWLFSCRRCP